ncbi:hypothetical protein [Sphingorhabdus sp.]|uniref:hypothetical protein n=1 Tax=Sphingorhabdus sp. TaxID=1902408 RepID=UPI0032B7C5EF
MTFSPSRVGLGHMNSPAKSLSRKRPNYFTIAMDAWALAAESNMVIAMRLGALAFGGPAAAKEAERMVSEKVAANMALGFDLMTGKLGTSPEQIMSGSIAHYSRRVRRNRERLAK